MTIHASSDTPTASIAGTEPAPFEDRNIQVGGVRLHYLDYGTEGRTPLLFMHGGGAHAHWFDLVAGSFSADYHVLALDQRGHGDSDWVDPPAYSYDIYAADLAGFVEKLDLRDFTLVGHSMGGGVSLTYAARHPGRVKRLVIVDTSLNMGEERVAAMRDVGSRPGTEYATREGLIARYRLRPTSTTTAPEVVHYIAGHSGRQFPGGAWRLKFDRNVFATRIRVDVIPLWSDIRMPVLYVKGDRSHRITPQIYAAVKERCPQLELAEVPHSDHHITLDNPAGFVAAVKPFLAKHPC